MHLHAPHWVNGSAGIEGAVPTAQDINIAHFLSSSADPIIPHLLGQAQGWFPAKFFSLAFGHFLIFIGFQSDFILYCRVILV
jgi:hypothetical protein